MTERVIAHWAESCNGGGERVGWELARTFDEPLHVGTRDPSIEPDDVTVRELFADSNLARHIIDRGGLGEMVAYGYLWQTPAALADADTVITSGNEPLFYVPDGEQTWVSYQHHTSRQGTDLLAQRYDHSATGAIARCVRMAERAVLTSQATKPDHFVANSEPVASRIHRYWGVPESKISVVYPPVPVESFGADRAPTEDYYLTLSRLDWHKRLGPVVDAFADLDATLVVAGDGQERDQLEARAPPNVEFVGYVSEDRKRQLYAGARAVINNALAEDFGLTTVEPLAAGTPVIGVAEGMTQHLIRDGETGIVYERGDVRDAVRRFERDGVSADPAAIERFADRFSVEQFREELRSVVETVERETAAKHAPEWERERVAADGGERE